MVFMRSLVAAAIAGAVLASVAAAATKPKTTHTAVGMAAAQHALILTVDLGAGWTAGPATAKPESLSCGKASSTTPGVVEIGSAASPTFRASASGPFVSQAAFVYGTASEATTLWRRVAGPSALACLATSVADGGAKGVRFSVVRRQPLSRSAAGIRSSAYRVIVRAVTKQQKVTAYVDMVLLRRGAALTALSFAGFSQPVATSTELSVVRLVAGRL